MLCQTYGEELEETEAEAFLLNSARSNISHGGRIATRLRQNIFGLILLIISCVMFCLSLWVHLLPVRPTDQQCVRQLNAPCMPHADRIKLQLGMLMLLIAPVYDVFEYEDVQFDNAFWKPSPYKGKPTPELEARWKELWYYGSFDLPDSYLEALNKSSEGHEGDRWARTSSGNLLAGLEVFHNLHCLNLLRQFVHREEYDYSGDPAFHGDAELVLAHVDHCIEALRIRLQCAGDVTPFLHTTGAKGIQPDFDSQHRCPKYDRIIEWAKERQIMVNKPATHEGHGH
ncbi:uncharacterized protein CTRU02_211456 [Colletotrichum truncatum]|uniref:Uncharacterized protein n=1 Tax=Colletotrichum truncatum TaxID=5467 RepID=A0ACC3YS34_COLTU|nr:uncharacterized protein CTRU02_02236 [Colletotrichum truncatum]KAF6799365.1 hypothetical protein CTRU02_02236 [Colletotrichum truncatum]